MTANALRRSFLDFFKGKKHTIVPSSSLLPESPNLLFTNAGMNQFVPIFLGERSCPWSPRRAADTQKCIRAGGKHNDLEDVGMDTYHHTFFEMLGNWSFGDYFKREAIEWAWELLTQVWEIPKEHLYATVYAPGAGEPSEFDEEAHSIWSDVFSRCGLDPRKHIVRGGKKDNFWMMGDTGPCGPCSEIHIDLTPNASTGGSLVNAGAADCMEIWNLVFIQFNANPDGSFSPLPARHVDTGMGFERVASVIQCTQRFTDFSKRVSNYETDVFSPIFAAIHESSGKTYGSTLPGDSAGAEQIQTDVAFRVIADHLRTLSFSIADGIQPGNTDRNYVLRRILRRAVRYGRNLGYTQPFLHRLVGTLADSMGGAFPELVQQRSRIEEVILREEENFNRTLDRGIELFNAEAQKRPDQISGACAFRLYDEQGFPLDLTQLLAREHGLSVDVAEFDRLMDEQRERARAARKTEIIAADDAGSEVSTQFVGYELLDAEATVIAILERGPDRFAAVDVSPFYAEMGGQVGDTGEIATVQGRIAVTNAIRRGPTFLLKLGEGHVEENAPAALRVDVERRRAIQRHHTVTHLLHWALHEVVGSDISQKGSYVGPEKLTFDFNSAALSRQQVEDIERLVNERVIESAPVHWFERPYDEVRERSDIMQFFGDKYGDTVRVVQIGGREGGLNGYSMELCAGTHTRSTGEVGLFRIVSEGAVAAGIRRIEAVSGHAAMEKTLADRQLIERLSGKVGSPINELEKKVDALLARQKELEKALRQQELRLAAEGAGKLLGKARDIGGIPAVVETIDGASGDQLQAIADALRTRFDGVVFLAGSCDGSVSLVAAVGSAASGKAHAGKMIQAAAPIVDGKGGGRPEAARGAGRDVSKIPDALLAVEAALKSV